MTRQFTEHAKQYLRQYFKNRYENDQEFRKRAHESNNISRHRIRLTKKIEMMTLDVLAECYQRHILT